MKKISYLLSIVAMSATLILQSCGKDKDTVPAAPATGQKVIINMNNTTQLANTDTVSLKVAASETSATIEMVVDAGTSDLDNIYIMRSVDNGPLMKFSTGGSVTNTAGTGGEV